MVQAVEGGFGAAQVEAFDQQMDVEDGEGYYGYEQCGVNLVGADFVAVACDRADVEFRVGGASTRRSPCK